CQTTKRHWSPSPRLLSLAEQSEQRCAQAHVHQATVLQAFGQRHAQQPEQSRHPGRAGAIWSRKQTGRPGHIVANRFAILGHSILSLISVGIFADPHAQIAPGELSGKQAEEFESRAQPGALLAIELHFEFGFASGVSVEQLSSPGQEGIARQAGDSNSLALQSAQIHLGFGAHQRLLSLPSELLSELLGVEQLSRYSVGSVENVQQVQSVFHTGGVRSQRLRLAGQSQRCRPSSTPLTLGRRRGRSRLVLQQLAIGGEELAAVVLAHHIAPGAAQAPFAHEVFAGRGGNVVQHLRFVQVARRSANIRRSRPTQQSGLAASGIPLSAFDSSSSSSSRAPAVTQRSLSSISLSISQLWFTLVLPGTGSKAGSRAGHCRFTISSSSHGCRPPPPPPPTMAATTSGGGKSTSTSMPAEAAAAAAVAVASSSQETRHRDGELSRAASCRSRCQTAHGGGRAGDRSRGAGGAAAAAAAFPTLTDLWQRGSAPGSAAAAAASRTAASAMSPMLSADSGSSALSPVAAPSCRLRRRMLRRDRRFLRLLHRRRRLRRGDGRGSTAGRTDGGGPEFETPPRHWRLRQLLKRMPSCLEPRAPCMQVLRTAAAKLLKKSEKSPGDEAFAAAAAAAPPLDVVEAAEDGAEAEAEPAAAEPADVAAASESRLGSLAVSGRTAAVAAASGATGAAEVQSWGAVALALRQVVLADLGVGDLKAGFVNPNLVRLGVPPDRHLAASQLLGDGAFAQAVLRAPAPVGAANNPSSRHQLVQRVVPDSTPSLSQLLFPSSKCRANFSAYDGTMAQSTVRKLQNRTSMAPPPEPQSIDSPAFERLHPQAALNSSGSSTPTRHPSRQFSCTPTSAPRASFSREQLRQPAQLCLSWKRKPEARLRLVGTRLYCLQLLSIRELMKLKATIESSSLRGAAAAPTLEIPFGLPVANEADLNSAVEKISASAEAKTALTSFIQKKCLGPSVTQSVRYAMNELLARDFQQRFNRTGGKDARGRGQQENSKMSFDKCFGGIVKDALGSSFTLHDINKAIERFFDGVRKRRSHEGSAESDVAGGHGAPTPSRRRSTMRVQRISDSTDEENIWTNSATPDSFITPLLPVLGGSPAASWCGWLGVAAKARPTARSLSQTPVWAASTSCRWRRNRALLASELQFGCLLKVRLPGGLELEAGQAGPEHGSLGPAVPIADAQLRAAGGQLPFANFGLKFGEFLRAASMMPQRQGLHRLQAAAEIVLLLHGGLALVLRALRRLRLGAAAAVHGAHTRESSWYLNQPLLMLGSSMAQCLPNRNRLSRMRLVHNPNLSNGTQPEELFTKRRFSFI
uniref:RING-type domain-containing protein n=1 Tax=Macrostomum lignano TaxID=282301 RepID=A0A1I8FLY3_9PLAT